MEEKIRSCGRILYVIAVILVFAALFVFVLFSMYNRGDIGMTEKAMYMEVSTGFGTSSYGGDVGETMAVFLCCSEDGSDFDSKIYVKRSGKMGWFFRFGGGSLTEQANHVVRYTSDNNGEYALISMNPMGVSSIEINKGLETEILSVKDSRPFALIMDKRWEVTLHDANGAVVEPVDYNL